MQLFTSLLLSSTTYITGCGENCRIQYTFESNIKNAGLGLFELKIIQNKETGMKEKR